jgi:hypothetical protein
MTKPKRVLPKVAAAHTSLGLPTIMDRSLAVAHGAPYVHLAAFAIDIDRIYWLDPERTDVPFGWEVFLTECYVLGRVHPEDPAHRDMLEAVCLDIMEETPGEPPLGGQLAFAVFDAVQRKRLPSELRRLFTRWRKPLEELQSSLDALWNTPEHKLVELARFCLAEALTPPLSPPTQAVLRDMGLGKFPLPHA